MEKCLNCGIDLVGDYCYACGQKRYERKDRTVAIFIRSFFEESFSFDSKFLKSLKLLLLRPGFLTNEFFSGRVSSYITPLKMYLFVSVVSFFIGSLVSPDDLASLSENFEAKEFINNYISSTGISYEVFETRFNSELQGKMPLYFLALVILFSLPLKVIYLHTKRLYVEHLVFSLHFFTFLLITIIFTNLLELILPDTAYLFFFILPFNYLLVAVKRVYKQNLVLSFFETLILFLYYIGLLLVWILAVFLITLLTV